MATGLVSDHSVEDCPALDEAEALQSEPALLNYEHLKEKLAPLVSSPFKFPFTLIKIIGALNVFLGDSLIKSSSRVANNCKGGTD